MKGKEQWENETTGDSESKEKPKGKKERRTASANLW